MSRRHGLGLAITLAACASGPSHVPDPKDIGARWGAALRDDRPETAYELLAPRLRATIDRARFVQLWRENRPELAELGQRLRETDAKAVAQAQVQLEDGEQIGLVLEQGQWRIAGGVLDAQALGTPLDAVAELRRALERQSLPALLRVLSRERRAAWVSAFEKTVEQTSDALDLRVEINQDDAIVHLTGGGEILLKREAGRWQVWDVR